MSSKCSGRSGWLVFLAAALASAACASQVNDPLGDDGVGTHDSGGDATLGQPDASAFDSAVPDAAVPDATLLDTGSPMDSGALNQADTSPAVDAGTDAGCGASPSLHPGDGGADLFCPFATNGGGPTQCQPGHDLCCISGLVGGQFPLSDCEPLAQGSCAAVEAGVDGSTQLACEDPSTDCPAGDVCCGAPNSIAPAAGCSYDRLVGFLYTQCEHAAGCAAGEFQVCENDSQCSNAQTCVPFKAKGLDLGRCQ